MNFIAQALLANDQEALAFERLALPNAEPLASSSHDAEARIVAYFVLAPTLFQVTHADEAAAARMKSFDPFRSIDARASACHKASSASFKRPDANKRSRYVIGPRERRIEADGLLIKLHAFVGHAVFDQDRRQRIPQHRFLRASDDRRAQGLDGRDHLALLALDHAQIVEPSGESGRAAMNRRNIFAARRSFSDSTPLAQIEQQIGIVGIERECAFGMLPAPCGVWPIFSSANARI